MKIVVTGGNGFVGRAIVSHLDSCGHEVVSVSRNGDIRLDIRRPEFSIRLREQVKDCDVIVHCASLVSASLVDREISLTNCVGTQEIIRTASLMNAKKIVHISSIGVIGRPAILPVDEDHPLNPPSAYHASKIYGERLLDIASSPTLSTTSLRITSPIGAGASSERIFGAFLARTLRGDPLVLQGFGGRRQNFVDVSDIARAVEGCLPQEIRGTFNIAGASAISNLELARHCIDVIGGQSTITFSDVLDPDEELVWNVSTARAKRSFGYAPVYSIDDSIRAACRTL